MYQIDFNKPIHIHFIGIGGISMSGLAKLLNSRGFTISGSDWHSSDLTKELEALGIQIFIGQQKENITNDIDLVVYTAAVKEDNEEFLATIEANIPLMPRSILLGQIMKQYLHAVGIAGTHGKTTTTSLLSALLLAGELDPTISVGGVLNLIGGNLRIGHSDYFVAEACEYTNSFLSFLPKIGMNAYFFQFFKLSASQILELLHIWSILRIRANIFRHLSLLLCDSHIYLVYLLTISSSNWYFVYRLSILSIYCFSIVFPIFKKEVMFLQTQLPFIKFFTFMHPPVLLVNVPSLHRVHIFLPHR